MGFVRRAALPLQVVSVAAALSVAQRGGAATASLAEEGPMLPMFGWRPGDQLRGGGPEQMPGARGLAARRQAPRPQAAAAVAKARHSSRFPVHLQARILLPKAKLAFCYMPKVASSQIARLFFEMNDIHSEGWWVQPWEYSGPQRLNISWDDVTKENGWKFAFLHRDPLARYLSAFGSKCMMNANNGVVEGAGKDCLGQILWTAVPMETMIGAFEERAQNDLKTGRPVNNSHWFPMTKNLRACGIDKFHPSVVDFHGSIDQDANDQVRRMFENTGVLQAYPNASALVDKYFPKAEVGGHWSFSHNRQADFYRNLSTMQAIAKLYEEDYDRLNLTLPPQLRSLHVA